MGNYTSESTYTELENNILKELSTMDLYCKECYCRVQEKDIYVDGTDRARCKTCKKLIYLVCNKCGRFVCYTVRNRHFCHQHKGGDTVFK